MKKLTASLALLAFMFSTAALAAESAKPAPGEKPPHKERRFDGPKGKGEGKPRPKFEDCDKDKDGALSLEEFTACFPRGGQERFAAIDADKDGKVTREEMKNFKEARMDEKRRELFQKCDKNNDGMLSFDEFKECKPEPKKDHRAGKKHPRKAPSA